MAGTTSDSKPFGRTEPNQQEYDTKQASGVSAPNPDSGTSAPPATPSRADDVDSTILSDPESPTEDDKGCESGGQGPGPVVGDSSQEFKHASDSASKSASKSEAEDCRDSNPDTEASRTARVEAGEVCVITYVFVTQEMNPLLITRLN